jgi:hypothetical protein
VTNGKVGRTIARRITPACALAAGAAAALLLGAPAAQAGLYGNAPWCAVLNIGSGEVEWECEYATVEACVPNVIAGNRGFCELNPYGAGPPWAGAPGPRGFAHRHIRARHARHRH